MVVQYLFEYLITILPSPSTIVFLLNAKLLLVEHYFLDQIPPTSTSAILASRLTMLLLMEMTFMCLLLLASTLLRVVVLLRPCARPLLWVIDLIVVEIRVNYKIVVQKKWFDISFFFFLVFFFIVCNFFLF
jgi:hypothetical protein